jgi:hypothetical protein
MRPAQTSRRAVASGSIVARTTAWLLCALASSGALAHGGLSMDEDYCKLRVGRYLMHFVGYQPDTPSGPKEFCEDIPETGRTIVVLDYLNEELRDLPTEVRIIRDTGSEQKLDDITLLHLPPKVYPSGSLNFEMNFPEPGKFVGLVTVGGGERLISRFPFSVGRRGSWLQMLVPVGLVLVGSVFLYRFGIRRRSKATRTA